MEKEEWVERDPQLLLFADRPSFEVRFFAHTNRRPDLSGSNYFDQHHRCGTVPEFDRTSLDCVLHIFLVMR
jgi:hypothetical protein